MQNHKLYVGNLPYSVTEGELKELFTQCGEVREINLIVDNETGRPKGFAFIEMGSPEDADDAIDKFDGYLLKERSIKVNKARPKRDDNRRGGNGGGGRRYNN